MLGIKIPNQLTFGDVLGWRERVPEGSFAFKLNKWASDNIKDEDFIKFYSKIGRPSVPPSIVVRALIYQVHCGLSDRQMEEHSLFNDLAKYALGVERDYKGLDAVTLCRNRQRLGGNAARLLAKTIQDAVSQGYIDEKDATIVDSYLTYGAAATQDTYTLLRRAILKNIVVIGFAGYQQQLSGLLRDDYDLKGKPQINWDKDDEKKQLLSEIVADARYIIKFVDGLETISDEMKEAIALLKKILDQDIDADGNIKQGVAPDRVISVTDSEMRHGRKTTANKFDGYKTHIAAAGEDHSFVVGLKVTPANVPDGDVLPELIEACKENQVNVNKAMGDTAYGSGDIRAKMQEQNIELVAKVPPASSRKGCFSKNEFNIDIKNMICSCPAGQETSKTYMVKDAQGREVPQFVFPRKTCANCPLREKCFSGKTQNRTVTLNYHEELLQEARQKQETPEFKEEYRQRSHVERTISQNTRHGGRQGRYFGVEKNELQQVLVSIGTNIVAFFRYAKQQVSSQTQKNCIPKPGEKYAQN